MIVSVVGHVNESPQIDDAELMRRMNENLCRCCGYAEASARPSARRPRR